MPVKRRPSARTAPKPKAEGERGNARARVSAPAEPVEVAIDAEAMRLRRICDRIRGGSSLDAASWREGINPQTIRSRMARHPDVHADVESARSEAEDARRERLDELVAAGMPTGGLTWQLERLHRATFYLPTKIAMGQDPDAGPVQVERAEMTEAQIRDRVRLLAEKIGSGS